MNTSEPILNESLNIKSPARKIDLFLYYLVRFYVVFVSFNLLLVKLAGFEAFTYWKDVAYLIAFFLGMQYIIRVKAILIYTILIALIFVTQLLQGLFYLEYFTWFIMGLPVFMYIRFILPKDFDVDCYIIGFLMIIGAFWIFIFESHGGYEYTFAKELENTTLAREGGLRVRFCFVSPMALSQYAWFSLLIIYFNKRLHLWFRIIACALILYVLVVCNTRAGIVLVLFSICIGLYARFFKVKKGILFLIYLVFSTLLIIQIIISASAMTSDVSLADADRLLSFLKGIQNIQTHYLLGGGGAVFFTEVSAGFGV